MVQGEARRLPADLLLGKEGRRRDLRTNLHRPQAADEARAPFRLGAGLGAGTDASEAGAGAARRSVAPARAGASPAPVAGEATCSAVSLIDRSGATVVPG